MQMLVHNLGATCPTNNTNTEGGRDLTHEGRIQVRDKGTILFLKWDTTYRGKMCFQGV